MKAQLQYGEYAPARGPAFTTDPDDFRKRMVADRAEFLTVCTPNYLHCTHTVTGLEAPFRKSATIRGAKSH